MTTAPTCTRCGESIGPADRFCPRCGADVSGVQASIATAVVHQHAPPAPAASQAAQLDAVRQATLGEYEILGELGRGGMASVYLAHDIALDRRVAIKVMAPALLSGEGMAERFKREARTAASLSHPNIIPIYAVRDTEHALYFVMKLIEGRPLDSIIHEIGPLPIPMVQAILHQVGAALGYAHKHGVVHRDVKAANVMVDSGGGGAVPASGIAKVAEAHGLTVTGATVGTPSYMSPEQCDAKELTGASDQYSLGVVAYEMLTGALPFKGDSTMSVLYAHFNERPRPLAELRPDCPPNLAAGVMRMLEKDPLARWPSMDDVGAVCGRPSLRHDDPVRAEMISLARAGGRWAHLDQLKTPTSPIVLSKSRVRGHPGEPTVVTGRRAAGLWWALGAALIAIGAGVALWRFAPWRPSAVPVRLSVDTAAPAPVPAAPPPVAKPAQRPPPRNRVATGPPPGAARESARTPGTQRADSLLRSLRDRALGAMTSAIAAGATPAELARGDTVFKGAEALAAQSRGSEAM